MDRGVMELERRAARLVRELSLGPGHAHGGHGDLRSPLSSRPRTGVRRGAADRQVHLVGKAVAALRATLGPWYWPSAIREDIPMACMVADLPEPVQEGVGYRLEGVGPTGAFFGEVVVPAAPAILDPADTILLERPPGPAGSFEIPIRYRAPAELGGLRPEMLAIYHDGGSFRWLPMSPYAEMDVNGGYDTLRVEMDSFIVANIEAGYIHLLGLGSRYVEFLQMDGRMRAPWDLGVTGDRVFGYFDGAAASSPPLGFVVQDGEPGNGAVTR
ncbi:MAG: hypothetical protein J4F34_00080 [Gemmatimonadetes bacterium]|nr:hypothetical protein [Gemmatimonadota bacterium]